MSRTSRRLGASPICWSCRPLGPTGAEDVLNTTAQRLTTQLRDQARNGAWLSLVGSVHWKMLADLLGVADTAASAWHRENGGDRAGYVAGRLPQEQRIAGPE
jgi:hypothetical protein